MEQVDTLPQGWAWEQLGELGTWSGGGTPSKAEVEYWENGTIPWVSPKDMKSERIRSSVDLITENAVRNCSAKYIPAESVLMVTRSGILSHTFPVAVNEQVVTVNQDIKTVTLFPGIDPDYVAWYLRGSNCRILKACSKHGTTVASIDTERLKGYPVPVATRNEQIRIVEKIESLFAQLDKGEESLREVQKLLARYRQSVLKAAVTGQLTAKWRAENVHRTEHDSNPLQDILKARRDKWKGRGKYKEPASPAVSGLPELPADWVWASIEQISSSKPNALCIGPFGSNLKVDDYREEGVPLVFVRNIRNKEFSGPSTRYVSEEKACELSSHKVLPGDLLITKMGDPPGDVCIYPSGAPAAVITADCIRLCATRLVSTEYIEKAISSHVVQSQILRITKGVAQRKVTLANFKRVAIPLPPIQEQLILNRLLEMEIARISQSYSFCERELARSAALRQSILKAAFSGRLVPQDPNDEPAAELLARIKATRTTKAKKPSKKATA